MQPNIFVFDLKEGLMRPVRLIRSNAERRFPFLITARPSQAVPCYRYPSPGSANRCCVAAVYRRPFASGLAG